MQSHRVMSETLLSASAIDMSAPFDHMAGNYDGLVIAGASGLVAQHTLQGLARGGIRLAALADNNPTLQATRVNGIPVLSPLEAIKSYPDAAFVAAIFTHTPLRRQLSALGATRVLPYAVLFHKFPELLLPYFAVDLPSVIAQEAPTVSAVANFWADEESRILYAAILNWFVNLASESVPAPSPSADTYIPEFLQLREDEVFVDCGAFDGDTVLQYARASQGRYRKIIALEPDPYTFQKLASCAKTIDRVATLNAGAGAAFGKMPFIAGGLMSSHAASAGAAGFSAPGELVYVDLIRLDDLSPRPTYVKMDIEGFERQALAGARGLLSAGETAFAVTLYHRMSDLWQIARFIHDVAPGLRLYLRHYAEDWAETICYAVPPNRVIHPTIADA